VTPELRDGLRRSGLLRLFVDYHGGRWGHREWLVFRDLVYSKYGTFDADQLGLLLEQERAAGPAVPLDRKRRIQFGRTLEVYTFTTPVYKPPG
jgi:hypothetical protein